MSQSLASSPAVGVIPSIRLPVTVSDQTWQVLRFAPAHVFLASRLTITSAGRSWCMTIMLYQVSRQDWRAGWWGAILRRY
jgi:hypothetical protein